MDRLCCGMIVVGALGCGGDKVDSSGVEAEELRLPDDPSTIDMPVGVRTLDVNGVPVEVWYPAPDSVAGEAGESVALLDLVPDSVRTVLGDVSLPSIDTIAIRDAPLRPLVRPMPVVYFSHGFGGFPQQSVDLTSHLAGRGYVVFSTRHVGRSITDLLPCLFSPPLDGCTLSPNDPGPDDITGIQNALAEDAQFLTGAIDLEVRAVVGHSAGGGTVSTLAESDEGLDAAVVMAAPPMVTSAVPVLLLDGSCDAIIPEAGVSEAFSTVPSGVRVQMAGAGHLAFSDICDLEFGTLADELLAPRDDINEIFLDQLSALGTDGCPGGTVGVPECAETFLDLAVTAPVIRAATTAFLDLHLRGEGTGVASDYGADFTVTTP
jgi:predicted dienelactone hydrolase